MTADTEPTATAMGDKDEPRIRELLDIHPALLQPEAIELRRHLLGARDDLAAAHAEVGRLRTELAEARAQVAEEQRIADDRRTELLEERDSALHNLQEAETDRDRRAGQVKRAYELADRWDNALATDRAPARKLRATLDGTESS